MNRFVRTTCLTTFAGAALFSAPAYAAPTAGPGVSATPSITYTTDGTTVAFNFNLKGTQHHANGPDHTTTRTPGPMSMSVDFGDGKGRTGGDSGVLQCTSKGVSPLNFSSPYQYRYTKPGTYKVKLDFWYCGDANNSHVTKTVDVKIGASAQPVPTPSKPGTSGGTTTGSTTVGPKVQTDMTHEGSSTNTTAAFAGGALLVAAGGTLVVRRRTR